MPVVHCKKEKYDVYIGRPSKWGNPFTHKQGTAAQTVVESRDAAIAAYKRHLWAQVNSGEVTLDELAALDGKTLGCWCHPQPCHGEVLLAAAAWARDEIAAGLEQEADAANEQYIAEHFNEVGRLI